MKEIAVAVILVMLGQPCAPWHDPNITFLNSTGSLTYEGSVTSDGDFHIDQPSSDIYFIRQAPPERCAVPFESRADAVAYLTTHYVGDDALLLDVAGECVERIVQTQADPERVVREVVEYQSRWKVSVAVPKKP